MKSPLPPTFIFILLLAATACPMGDSSKPAECPPCPSCDDQPSELPPTTGTGSGSGSGTAGYGTAPGMGTGSGSTVAETTG